MSATATGGGGAQTRPVKRAKTSVAVEPSCDGSLDECERLLNWYLRNRRAMTQEDKERVENKLRVDCQPHFARLIAARLFELSDDSNHVLSSEDLRLLRAVARGNIGFHLMDSMGNDKRKWHRWVESLIPPQQRGRRMPPVFGTPTLTQQQLRQLNQGQQQQQQ
ncbi:hypothetical protein EBZ80_17975 [bacterium]|nr:hypothetical protein [bacterium]